MKSLFTIFFLYLPFYFFSQGWHQIGQDIQGEFPGDFSGSSLDMNSSGDILVVGSEHNDANGPASGSSRVFSWDGNTWQQLGIDLDGESQDDEFGHSVSINGLGDIIAVGAYGDDANGSNAGHARVFKWDGVSWQQLGVDLNGESSNSKAGWSVSLNESGDVIAIGEPNNLPGGQVRIYNWDGVAWVQQGADIHAQGVNSGSFGSFVELNNNGDLVAIGSPVSSSGFGTVSVYAWDGTSWTQKGSSLVGEAYQDQFGYSVSINNTGDVLAVGAPENDGNGSESGHVRAFEWDGFSWQQLGLDLYGEDSINRSGQSVSLNATGDILAIGAPYNSGDTLPNYSGHVRVFKWDGISWIQNSLDIDGVMGYFGSSVSFNSVGDKLAVGAPQKNTSSIFTVCSSFENVTDNVFACDSVTWIDGNSYYSSTNSVTHTVYSSLGCDTLIALDLTIANSTSSTDTQVVCNSYTWIDGTTYTINNNTATHLLTNYFGCDSLVSLDLTINNVDNGITNNSPTLSANLIGAIYLWLDCDNNFATINGETNQVFTATSNGNYAVAVTQNGCTDTSACEMVHNVSITENSPYNLTIYPNPTSDQIKIDIKGYNGVINVEVYDLQGRLLETTKNITVSLKKHAKGIYVLKVSYGEITEEIRVVRG